MNFRTYTSPFLTPLMKFMVHARTFPTPRPNIVTNWGLFQSVRNLDHSSDIEHFLMLSYDADRPIFSRAETATKFSTPKRISDNQ